MRALLFSTNSSSFSCWSLTLPSEDFFLARLSTSIRCCCCWHLILCSLLLLLDCRRGFSCRVLQLFIQCGNSRFLLFSSGVWQSRAFGATLAPPFLNATIGSDVQAVASVRNLMCPRLSLSAELKDVTDDAARPSR